MLPMIGALGAGIIGQGVGDMIGGGGASPNLQYAPLDQRSRGLLHAQRFNAGGDAQNTYSFKPGDTENAERMLQGRGGEGDPYSSALASRAARQYSSGKQQVQSENERMRELGEQKSLADSMPNYEKLVTQNENMDYMGQQASNNANSMRNQAIASLIGGVGSAAGVGYGYLSGSGNNKYSNAAAYGSLGGALGSPFQPMNGPRRLGG